MKYVLDSNVALKWVLRELAAADDRLVRSLQPTFPFIAALVPLP